MWQLCNVNGSSKRNASFFSQEIQVSRGEVWNHQGGVYSRLTQYLDSNCSTALQPPRSRNFKIMWCGMQSQNCTILQSHQLHWLVQSVWNLSILHLYASWLCLVVMYHMSWNASFEFNVIALSPPSVRWLACSKEKKKYLFSITEVVLRQLSTYIFENCSHTVPHYYDAHCQTPDTKSGLKLGHQKHYLPVR